MKKSKAGTNSSNHTLKSLKTDQTLSKGICQNAFFNILRSEGNSTGYPETKMTFVPIKVNQQKVSESHIFTG